MTERTATASQAGGTGTRSSGDSAAAGFERLYRANVEAVTSYFARRSADPQVVADLTADTFVTAITSFASFDPGKGTARSWVFGIARHVYAAYCEAYGQQQDRLERLAGRRDLEPDQVCPKPPPPAVSGHGVRIITQFSVSRDGSVTVNAQGIPAGDILVVGMQANGHIRNAVAIVTSPPAPSCISPPAPPASSPAGA